MREIIHYLLFIFVIVAFIWDVRHQKIPNWLTLSGMLFGLVFHLINGAIEGFLFAITGLLAAGVICLILYGFKAVGAGDVKLFAAIGAFTGIEIVLYILMYSIVFGGIIGMLLLLLSRTSLYLSYNKLVMKLNKQLKKEWKLLDKEKKIITFPFMYAVLPAMITVYYYTFF
ncbi:A24 family peptidase [Oceanobacillus sp. M65]|uniref:A24 family peptidase n=1 Tax=Oceanobacillus sp. M65 TaxID=3457435 RepID=UPI003FCE2F23